MRYPPHIVLLAGRYEASPAKPTKTFPKRAIGMPRGPVYSANTCHSRISEFAAGTYFVYPPRNETHSTHLNRIRRLRHHDLGAGHSGNQTNGKIHRHPAG